MCEAGFSHSLLTPTEFDVLEMTFLPDGWLIFSASRTVTGRQPYIGFRGTALLIPSTALTRVIRQRRPMGGGWRTADSIKACISSG